MEALTHSKFKPYFSIFEDSTRKFEISSNSTGRFVIFSEQRFNSQDWLLGVYNHQTKSVTYIERADIDLTTPTWVNENSVAYRVKRVVRLEQ